jgi:membrane protein DedA with SNARE-associated domain
MPSIDIAPLVSFLEASRYVLIFTGAYIEGSVVMMATGSLLHGGIVSFWPAYGALLLGDILSDTMWYCIGRWGGRPFLDRWGRLFNATPEVISKVERRFHEYHTSILIVSKLTMGFGFAVATLMTAGLLKVPFSRYFTINLVGGFVWIFALMMIGYYFGNLLELVPRNLQIAAAIGGVIAAVLALRYAGKRLATMDW